jgi:hypothetical protein
LIREMPKQLGPPPLTPPHKSLRPGARKRGPGGEGNTTECAARLVHETQRDMLWLETLQPARVGILLNSVMRRPGEEGPTTAPERRLCCEPSRQGTARRHQARARLLNEIQILPGMPADG